MKTRHIRPVLLAAGAFLTGLGVVDVVPGVGLAQRAVAQDYVSRVNAAYSPIAPSKRSDTVLLPLLAKMEKPPAACATPERAGLLPAKSSDFAAAAAWAQGGPQQAALEGLRTVTQESDWKKAYAFGQPYGAESVPPELIRAGLYTELGDPPMLAGARHLYMPALEALVCLANVEATRLAAEGRVADAVDLLINLAYFARQMCDRQFYEECSWGLEQMARAQERMRDVAYTDLRGARKYDHNRIPEQIRRLAEGTAGYMSVDRIKFPQGNRLAAEQLVARLYDQRGKVNDLIFASTMSRLGSRERPLRLFSEAAQYQGLAQGQVSGFEAEDRVKGVHDDFERRWNVPYYDKSRPIVSEYAKLDRDRNTALAASTPDMNALTDLKQLARVEAAGTRMALALCGFTLLNGALPPTISAVRPFWMAQIEHDPFNLFNRSGARPAFEYFIPMPPPANPREVPRPHEMQVFTANGEANFKVSLQNDVFILFSHGSDNANNGAFRVQNTIRVVQGADYLVWPPVISLYRQHLIDRGDLNVNE